MMDWRCLIFIHASRRYGVQSVPVVGQGKGEQDLVVGIVTDVEVSNEDRKPP